MRIGVFGARVHCAVFLALLSAAPAKGQPLADRLDTMLREEPIAQRAFVGVVVLEPETGELLFSRQGAQLFTPASNTKLFSTSLALSRLGPEHRMRTEAIVNGKFVVAEGTLHGDLVLKGYGDPSIGSRVFPYTRENGNQRDFSLPAFEALADAIVARGVRRVTGDVVGDDAAYFWEPFREGWAQDDALYDYGAPVSALTVNDNAVTVTVRPGDEAGLPAVVSVKPALPFYDVLNEVKTVNGGLRKIRWERVNGSQLLLLEGTLPVGSRPWAAKVAIDDPALFAARFLRDALIRRGVEIEGPARAHHRYPAEEEESAVIVEVPADAVLAQLFSPPLRDIVRTVNKESMNLFAELLLCEVSRVKNGVGSRKAGLEELRSFLEEADIEPEGVAIADGSGLARLNLVSPMAVTQLLAWMWRGEHRQDWLDSLPIGGYDGTLERRFVKNRFAMDIRAKTGTLRGVSALSGYATTRSGNVLAFSAIANNYAGSSLPARELLDKIALEIAATP